MAGVRDPAGGALVGRGALASGDTLVEKRATSSTALGGERHKRQLPLSSEKFVPSSFPRSPSRKSP